MEKENKNQRTHTAKSVKDLELFYTVKLIQRDEFLMFTFLQNSKGEIYRKLTLVRNPTGLFCPFFCNIKLHLFHWCLAVSLN